VKKKSSFLTWVTRLSWVVVLLDLLLIFLIPTEINADNLTLMIAYAVWLILTVFLATTWLMIWVCFIYLKWGSSV